MAQLFVISAPSGTGKTSLIHKVLEEELASRLETFDIKQTKKN